MSDNMRIYNAVRECPQDALKTIQAGRLKGKSDINPMWRIKKLTELYGPCGTGWDYDITKQWLETGANGEISAFCNINLYVRENDEWSKPIQGTGGSMLVAKESKGLYTSDECYKMALTDAISVACKALGVAADVYWNNDRTKYHSLPSDTNTPKQEKTYCCSNCGKPFQPFTARSTGKQFTAAQAYHMSEKKYGKALCGDCSGKFKQQEEMI